MPKNKFRNSIYPNMVRFRNTEYNELKRGTPGITKQEAFNIIESCDVWKCKRCGNDAKFVSLKLGYSRYCTTDCYDRDNNFQSFEHIIQLVHTGYELTTADFTKIRKFFNKTPEDVYIAVHGKKVCRHCSRTPSFDNYQTGYREFCSISCSNHYKDFSRTPEKNKIAQERRIKTTLERYGVQNNLELVNKTGANNILSKHNTTEKSTAAKNKKRDTMLQRYGTVATNVPEHIQHRENLNEAYIKEHFVRDNRFDYEPAMTYFNCSRSYFQKFDLPKRINCGEDWIRNITGGVTDRTLIAPLEIDSLSHVHKFGVEFNGLAWHSIGKSTSTPFDNYLQEPEFRLKHLNKTQLVERKNYQLFHIFEDEYLDVGKRKIWESVLKNKMGISNRIYARKCTVKELPSLEANQFIEMNHLQGKCVASIRLGLYYNNELVSIMTFGKSRYNKSTQYELIRFCSKLNTTVVGGASKLLKYFERNYSPSSIVSYANRRWSAGSLYETLGFEFLHNSAPNYFYFRGNDSSELHSRVKFQKHKLKGKLDVFDPNLTETQNMYNNGYRKIFDSGNKVYVWNSI